MPVLELVMDATGMQRGQQQAEAALQGVQNAATKTQASVTSVGTSLRNSFQVTQGGVQIATGIAQTAQAFQSLNSAAAGFVGARTLLEIGQTASQLAILRGGVGAVSAAFVTLGRAIPYVGLALSAATAAYAIFGGGVDNTTKKINAQVDAMDRLLTKARDLDKAARYLQPGQQDPRQSQRNTVDTLLALRGVPSATPYYAAEAASLFGVSEQELRYALARSGLGESALELRYPTHLTGGAAPGTSLNPYSISRFSAGQLVSAGESLLTQRRSTVSAIDPATGTAYGTGEFGPPAPLRRDYSGVRQVPFGIEGDATSGEAAMRAMEAASRQEEAMAKAAAYAEQIRRSLGAGVWDVLTGIQGWRQAMVSIINSIGRQGLSDLGSTLASSLFGATSRQAAGTTNPTWTPANTPFGQ